MIMALWPTKIENCFLKIVILSHEFSAASFCCNLVYLMFDPPCGFRTPKRRNSVLSVFHTTDFWKEAKICFQLVRVDWTAKVWHQKLDAASPRCLVHCWNHLGGWNCLNGKRGEEKRIADAAWCSHRDATSIGRFLTYKIRWEKTDTKSISVFQCPQRSHRFEAAHLGCISKFQSRWMTENFRDQTDHWNPLISHFFFWIHLYHSCGNWLNSSPNYQPHPTSGWFDSKDDKLETGFFMLGLDSLELVRVRNRSRWGRRVVQFHC